MKRIALFLVLIIPFSIKAVTMDEYNEAVARVAESAAGVYGDEFVYSFFWSGSPDNPTNMKDEIRSRRDKAKQGQKTSGKIYGTRPDTAGIHGSYTNKFSVYCETFVQLMVHYASNGAVVYSNDYERIRDPKDLKRGDLIHFEGHIAVYLGPGTTGTYRVSHASRIIQIEEVSDKSDGGYRLKQSALSKLNYNHVTSSYDFHDRLDDYAPIIKSVSLEPNSNKVKISATDYKHYDLNPPSDVIEPENNGIIGYQITTTSTTPTEFKTVDRTQTLDVTEEVPKDGTYYIWVKDVGGNVTSYAAKISGVVVDKTKPNIGVLEPVIFKNSIFVTINGASDESGIKEYRYYLNDKLIGKTDNDEYLFENLSEDTTYTFYYEVVDKFDNVSKSEKYTFENVINAKNIYTNDNYIKLTIGETYQIIPKIESENNNYTVKYKSSNTSVATVSDKGLVIGISSGDATITISVGKTEKNITVKVLKYKIIFVTKELPAAYVDKDYEATIITSPAGKVNLSGGNLPNGLRVENNTIKGRPTNIAGGKYTFLLMANVEDETAVEEYTLYVYQKQSSNYLWLLLIIPIALVGYIVVNKIKNKNTF